jgi:fatty acyl-ACP thioesterase A
MERKAYLQPSMTTLAPVTMPAAGELLGSATSTWVTINTATRKLAKLPDDLKARFMKFSTPAPRHSIPIEETKRKLPDLVEELKVGYTA